MARRKYLKPLTEYKLKIGQNIRRWRDLKGIKQSELARMLEIEPSAMSEIENDITELTLPRIEDIAEMLELRPEQLLENPQNAFNYNNCTQENVVGVQNNSTDKELLSKIIHLIDVVSNKVLAVKS